MIDRASSVGILAHRLMVVGILALVGGATACLTAPRREDAPNRYAFECPVGPRVVRVTNSGSRTFDVYLWTPLGFGEGPTELLGSVSPDKTEAFVLSQRGYVQILDANSKTWPLNRKTLRYEFLCPEADRAG